MAHCKGALQKKCRREILEDSENIIEEQKRNTFWTALAMRRWKSRLPLPLKLKACVAH
jgi:hypothetical protein